MQEAEVSLRVALYYIKNGLTNEDVKVSIDGAHIKTGNKIHFDIQKFLSNNCFIKVAGEVNRWQGIYQIEDNKPKIEIVSKPGIGDVVIKLVTGEIVLVESKKGGANKSGQEYRLMREAIGQLMTSSVEYKNMIMAVAVPFTDKACELAMRWSKLEQIKVIGIKFLLIRDGGQIEII